MNIIVYGATGHMGRIICDMIDASDANNVIARVSPELETDAGAGEYKTLDEYSGGADCLIDFSHHSATSEVTSYIIKRRLPSVIATTGQTDAEKELIYRAAGAAPVFFSANMSLGIAVLLKLAKQTAAAFPDADIEIVEAHHNRKVDAPSGTALLLLGAIKEVRNRAYAVFGRSGQSKRSRDEIGMHSLRMGNVVGRHEVIVCTENETITLTHEAHDRKVFADGALAAVDFITKMPAGLYSMRELLEQ